MALTNAFTAPRVSRAAPRARPRAARGVAGRDDVAAVERRSPLPVRHDAAGAFEDRDQRHDVVRLQLALDDEIDEPGREHRVVVAVAAEASAAGTAAASVRNAGQPRSPSNMSGCVLASTAARERLAAPRLFNRSRRSALMSQLPLGPPKNTSSSTGWHEQAEQRLRVAREPDQACPTAASPS